jgi:hypothetical protein
LVGYNLNGVAGDNSALIIRPSPKSWSCTCANSPSIPIANSYLLHVVLNAAVLTRAGGIKGLTTGTITTVLILFDF